MLIGIKMNEEIVIKNGFVLFWRGFPSNWHPSEFVINNTKFNCVEQFMMAEKAKLFNDKETLNKIMKSDSPKEQKKLGRKVKGFDDNKWATIRYNVVLKATIEKYKQNPDLLKLLLDTGENRFVECSPYDKVWGIGMGTDDPDATKPGKWKGENLLGKIITEARDILRMEVVEDFMDPLKVLE